MAYVAILSTVGILIWFAYKAVSLRTIDKTTTEYIELAKKLDGPPWPSEDSEGNSFANVLFEDVAGLTHRQRGCDPCAIVRNLGGEQVALAPDPTNEFDNKAIKVCTMNGRQFGWYPKKGCKRDEIFRRLVEKREIYAEVYDKGQRQNGSWWCKLRVCYYATSYDKAMKDK